MAYKQPPQVTITPAPSPQPTSVGSSSGIGGAVVNGVFGIGQSLLNNHFADKSAREQYNRQLEFWDMQNDYNDPLNQRMRLQRAGFNPAGVAGDIAQGSQAGELSSVPGNEYAQQGMFRLDSLAQVLETFSRIENIGSETDLNTAMLTSEMLRQTLIGLGIDEKRVDILIKDWEAKRSEVEFSQLGRFFEHRNTMYDLDEVYRSAEIEHERAITELANAHTEESKSSAKLKIAETGLIAIKAETEKSIQELNYSHTRKSDWETRKSVVLAPLERRAMELANKLQATEAQRAEISRILEDAEKQLLTNDDGTPSTLNKLDHWLEAIGEVFGVYVGFTNSGKSQSSNTSSGPGSGLFIPVAEKIASETWKRL